jgi:hypothetical protein
VDIDSSGRLDEAEVENTSLEGQPGGSSFEDCLRKSVRGFGMFGRDKSDAGGVVTYSAVFGRERRDGWKVRVDPVDVDGALSVENVVQTVGQDERDLLAACFFLQARRHRATADQHTLTARLTVDEMWGVEHAEMTDVTFEGNEGYDALDACLRRRFKAWRFPLFNAEKPTIATFGITVTRVPAKPGSEEAGGRP